jgi:hypothetical protein
MILVRKFLLLTAVRTMQGVERLLEMFFLSRPYIPFGIVSLVVGFLIGFFLIRR